MLSCNPLLNPDANPLNTRFLQLNHTSNTTNAKYNRSHTYKAYFYPFSSSEYFLFYLRSRDRKTDETEIVKKVKEVWPVDVAFGVAAEQQSNECICLPASFF